MTRALLLLTALAVGATRAAGGQASQFGVRGLGLPGLPISVRAAGTAGAAGLFDGESALNPASPVLITRSTASFNLTQSWRSTDNTFGRATGNDTQFPLFFAAGPMGPRLTGSLSASVYTDRTFALALEDTLILRDEQVIAFDTVLARGGLTDVRAALSYRGGRVALGVGLHLLTGNNRVDYRRIFSDSAYVPLRLRNELTYSGAGVSLGVLVEAVPRVHLAGLLRYDADLSIEKDSVASGDVPLPVTLGTGLRWEPSAALVVQGHLLSRRWGRADRALRDLGGSGARNTLELAGGVEWLRNPRNPDRFPLRLGLRRSPLPFPIGDGAQQPTEVVAALGTGLGFAGGRATLDLSLERAWRRETAAFRERGVALRIGIGVRP